VSEIIDTIRTRGNGFVQQAYDKEWIEVGNSLARDKVGQMFHNALNYVFSVKNKKCRWKQVSSKLQNTLHQVMVSNDTYIWRTMESTQEQLQESASLLDDVVMAVFQQWNAEMLSIMKNGASFLVPRFQTAESWAIKRQSDDEWMHHCQNM
jgi:hypothetical protein